jgi:hypothetical protein
MIATRLFSLVGMVIVLVMFSTPVCAVEDPVPAGRDALRSGSFPWYSDEDDAVQPITLPKVAKPKKAGGTTGGGGSWGFSAIPLFYMLKVLVIVLIVVAIAAGIFLMVRAFLERQGIYLSSVSEEVSRKVVSSEIDRIEELPFQVRRPQSNLLSEAELHYRQGDFNEAIIYLFSYQLLQLDKGHVIRLTRGKTNRQYLREARKNSSLGELLQKTVVAFEDVFFGNHELDRMRFEECWQGLPSFKELQPGGTA